MNNAQKRVRFQQTIIMIVNHVSIILIGQNITIFAQKSKLQSIDMNYYAKYNHFNRL